MPLLLQLNADDDHDDDDGVSSVNTAIWRPNKSLPGVVVVVLYHTALPSHAVLAGRLLALFTALGVTEG